ncbi:MAG: sigma 54-interacting transcriptional regulator [Candidatus Acidiferrum sp.]
MPTSITHDEILSSHPEFVRGQSDAIQSVNAVVEEIARTDIPVLLTGESGTGKEVYARLVHRLSSLGHLPLKKLNCAALEPSQIIAEFGVLENTPTDGPVVAPKTLYLDGIDELELRCQKVLLSLLPDDETTDRGGRWRLISSATRDLDKEIASGHFRKELYFRISGACLRLPPLRKRKDDIPALLEYFLAKHSLGLGRKAPQLSEVELELLVAHSWPGNIRELGNLARKIVALGNPKLVLEDLREASGAVMQEECSSSSLKVAARAASQQAERELILKALERTHWNRKRAAQELQISYKSLLYKIKLTGVERGKPGN